MFSWSSRNPAGRRMEQGVMIKQGTAGRDSGMGEHGAITVSHAPRMYLDNTEPWNTKSLLDVVYNLQTGQVNHCPD